ncbi:MAG: glycosyltransferase family 2 protein [Ilumatobacteraceae bacterium]
MISVVIPVYNSVGTLGVLAARLDGVAEIDEVVLVDDGSRDGSWSELVRLAAERPTWRALRLGRNAGQHSALLAGIRAAAGDVIVTMDDDLQHLPEQIPVLLDALGDDVDLVYGVPFTEEHGAARSFSSRLVKRMMRRSLGVEQADSISAFRCFRTHLRDAFDEVNDPFISLDVLLSWATNRVVPCTVEMQPRQEGESNYRFRGLVRHVFNMVTGYSAAPLRVVAYLGLMLSILGFGTLGYVLVRFVIGDSKVQGFTFLASLLSLVAGTQMLATAVLGEYLARVHFRAMKKPAYFVRESVGGR